MHNLHSFATLQKFAAYTFIACLFTRLSLFLHDYLQSAYSAHRTLLDVAKVMRMTGRHEGQSQRAQGERAPSVLSGNLKKDGGNTCVSGLGNTDSDSATLPVLQGKIGIGKISCAT